MRHGVMGFAVLALAGCATPQAPSPSTLDYADVERFYRVYDKSGGHPAAAILQADYLDPGSAALKDFIPNRIVSAERLARRIEELPAVYRDARRCLELMPHASQSFERSMQRFRELHPAARKPDVTFVIGRNNSGGTATDAGIILGLEVICRAQSPSTRPIPDRLDSLIAHEAAHASQPMQQQGGTLLEVALHEGVAELVADLVTGDILNDHLKAWTRGHEARIEQDFRADMNGTDLRKWIYNGIGTPAQPGDLAYWVGYRIARAYYERASDKRAALARLLSETDPAGILADSGWSER
jgi:hypothetical protein